jgi:hypothetical protein
MNVHVLDGLKLTVDRGPNWLFVKLRPTRNFANSVSELSEQISAMAAQHFIYRVVLELDELRALPDRMVEQLVRLQERLAEHGGALRLCGLSTKCTDILRDRELEAVLPNHETRQAAVLGSDVAALRQKMKEMSAAAGGDGAELFNTGNVWQQPCLQ